MARRSIFHRCIVALSLGCALGMAAISGSAVAAQTSVGSDKAAAPKPAVAQKGGKRPVARVAETGAKRALRTSRQVTAQQRRPAQHTVSRRETVRPVRARSVPPEQLARRSGASAVPPRSSGAATVAALAAAEGSSAASAPTLQVSDASTARTDDPVFLRSGSALVVDQDTDRVLLAKNADQPRPIASLTKLMTAAVVLDAKQPLDQVIEITDADIDTLKWSSSRLRPGTRLTREELLKLALMSSENRAAHALARNYPGGLAACVAAMNRKARELGMLSTRYVEPTGLSPQNESTAHDLALLVKAAYHYPLIREFSTHPESEVDVGRRTLQFRNTDHLVFNRGWDILLQKTGYINEAGHCLVLNALLEGRRVIVVLLDAWGKYSHFGDAQRIRNWLESTGFDGLRGAAPRRSGEMREGHEPRLMRTALVESADERERGRR